MSFPCTNSVQCKRSLKPVLLVAENWNLSSHFTVCKTFCVKSLYFSIYDSLRESFMKNLIDLIERILKERAILRLPTFNFSTHLKARVNSCRYEYVTRESCSPDLMFNYGPKKFALIKKCTAKNARVWFSTCHVLLNML